MSKEDTRESPLAQKCYWHRIIPEVGGHFDPCTMQGTPTTRWRPPLVGLEKCSQMHKRGWNNIKKKLLITTNSNSKSRLASSYSSQLRKSSGTRNTRRKKSQQAWFPEGAASGRPILQDPKVKQLSTDSWPCRVPNNRLLRFAGWAASLFYPGEARGCVWCRFAYRIELSSSSTWMPAGGSMYRSGAHLLKMPTILHWVHC